VDFEDGGVSDPAYEVADLLEHVSVRPRGLLKADDLVEALALSRSQRARLRMFRRPMAVYWLFMLLPGNPAHYRNPPGSLERASRLCLPDAVIAVAFWCEALGYRRHGEPAGQYLGLVPANGAGLETFMGLVYLWVRGWRGGGY
jgi:hypothetical protein